VDDATVEGSKSKELQQKHKGARKARSSVAMHARKGTMITRTKPSQSTRPARALERLLEAPACLTTC
jgi:hypothetical protein